MSYMSTGDHMSGYAIVCLVFYIITGLLAVAKTSNSLARLSAKVIPGTMILVFMFDFPVIRLLVCASAYLGAKLVF